METENSAKHQQDATASQAELRQYRYYKSQNQSVQHLGWVLNSIPHIHHDRVEPPLAYYPIQEHKDVKK